jgi:hypothetical protein
MAPSLAQTFESSEDFRCYSRLRHAVKAFDNSRIVGLSENSVGPRPHTLTPKRL